VTGAGLTPDTTTGPGVGTGARWKAEGAPKDPHALNGPLGPPGAPSADQQAAIAGRVALATLIRRGCQGGAAPGQTCPCRPCQAWRDWPGPYWGGQVACPCCGERAPRRAVDVTVGDYGTCGACGLDRQPVGRAAGPRCAMHRRWDAQQEEAARQRQAAAVPPRRLPRTRSDDRSTRQGRLDLSGAADDGRRSRPAHRQPPQPPQGQPR